MNKIRKVLIGSIGIYIFTVLSLAQAQNVPVDEPSQRVHAGQRIQEIYSQLNLTDDQKQKLEDNKKQHRAKMESFRQSMKVNKEALQQELMRPQLDLPKIQEIHNQIKLLQSQIEDARLSSILAVRSILTSEQFTKFNNLMHQHKKEHGSLSPGQ